MLKLVLFPADTIIQIIETYLGAAPNDTIRALYYVLAIFLIVFFCKMLMMVFRAIFNIKSNF